MEVGKHRKYLIRTFFKNYLELNRTEAEERETVESIRNGVEFKGANLWILIFAIFIASLGLNVNSTAVIIGAMLISPLMGPIMGVGLSVGLNDFELMKRSLKSFLVATLFSVMTATLYFLFTPLDEVQSELLARTSPTIYDVFIALVGGLAGIVALSTKGQNDRSELKVLYPSVKTVSISHAIELTVDSVRTDTITLAVLKFGKHPDAHEKQKITEWLKARTGAEKTKTDCRMTQLESISY